jgi:hypothetical protein
MTLHGLNVCYFLSHQGNGAVNSNGHNIHEAIHRTSIGFERVYGVVCVTRMVVKTSFIHMTSVQKNFNFKTQSKLSVPVGEVACEHGFVGPTSGVGSI